MSQPSDTNFGDPDFNWDAFVADAINMPRDEAIAAAWQAADPQTPAGQLAREAIETNAAGDAEAQRILNDITGRQDRLEIHLDGGGITDHSASADKLGRFMRSMATVLKDMAKASSGTARIRDGILISAPTPGSLILTFDVKPVPRPKNGLPRTSSDASENAAMRQLASIFLQAQDEESDVLDATIHSLRGKPRRSLKSVAKIITEAGWELSGDLVQRDGERASITLTSKATYRILDAVKESRHETDTVTASGQVDTWSWSRQTMRLELANGQAIEAYVPLDLASPVAHYNAERVNVDTSLERLTTYPTGDAGSARYSFTLQGISVSPMQTEIDH